MTGMASTTTGCCCWYCPAGWFAAIVLLLRCAAAASLLNVTLRRCCCCCVCAQEGARRAGDGVWAPGERNGRRKRGKQGALRASRTMWHRSTPLNVDLGTCM